jgi:multicomponent Na+:H+ antiporter subunit D
MVHVMSTLGMLAFTAWGFFLLLKQLDPKPTISIDTDWFYRRGAPRFVKLMKGPLARFESGFVGQIYEVVIRRPVLGVGELLRKFDGGIVDFVAVGIGRGTQAVSRLLKPRVSGHTQHYGLLMAIGVLVLLALAILVP